MEHWLAGFMAALIAWIFNRMLVAWGGDKAVIWLVPPLEEFLKTGAALILGAAVPLVHGVFGLLEAVHDISASARWGFWAGLASLVSHYLFGCVTLYVYRLSAHWLPAILAAAAVHTGWNLLIVGCLAPRLSKRR